MDGIEQFFYDYKYTAGAFFSFFGFLWVLVKLFISAYKAISSRAKLDQRNDWQSEYFDVQEARYDRLLDKYDELKELMMQHEITHATSRDSSGA